MAALRSARSEGAGEVLLVRVAGHGAFLGVGEVEISVVLERMMAAIL